MLAACGSQCTYAHTRHASDFHANAAFRGPSKHPQNCPSTDPLIVIETEQSARHTCPGSLCSACRIALAHEVRFFCMEARTSPKMKIISLKVSETRRATSLGLRPIFASACLSQTLAPVTYSIVSTRFDDRGCVISGTCTPAHHGKS